MANTLEEVQQLIWEQSRDGLFATNHGMSLKQALITPERISVIARSVEKSRLVDKVVSVWLVGRESERDGYQIILCEDGHQFGLASIGFSTDEHPVLVGWYGDLLSAFMGM